MEDLRGNWNSPKDRIKLILKLCSSIEKLPRNYLYAVEHNAKTFDGHFNDGRIFRDGQLMMPKSTIESLDLPVEMEKGVSGNMAKLMGAKPILVDIPNVANKITSVGKKIVEMADSLIERRYYGTYNELKNDETLVKSRELIETNTLIDKSNEFKELVDEFITNPEYLFYDLEDG